MNSRPPISPFLWSAVPVFVVDRITKMLAESALQPPHVPHRALGNAVRWTLLFNRDAAMNLTLGSWSRWGFATIAVVGIVIMLRWLAVTPADARWRAVALGLISGGALGNLLDRLRGSRGVVDFVDVGVGTHRFWTFNVADAGVTIGALLLACVLWRESSAEMSTDA